MYHTQIKNQALNTTFSHKDFHTATQDVNNLTLTEQRIYQHLWRYRHYPSVKFKNETIAKRIGCTIRTVQKATAKLHKAGLITKKQQDIYSPNQYTFQCELFIPYKNLILDKYLSRRTITITIPSLRAGMRVGNSIKFSNSSNEQKKEREVMTDVQKKWVLEHKNDPRIKEILNGPNAKAALFTPPIERLASVLELTEREKLNLVPFNEETLDYVFNQVYPVIQGYTRISKPIDNKMAWMIGIAKVYCKNNDIKADWQWYFDLCGILGIESRNSDSKPLVVKDNGPRNSSYKGEYGPGKQIHRQPEALSPEEQLRRWKKELEQREDRIAFYGVKPSRQEEKVIEKLKQQIEDGEDRSTKLSPWEQMQRILPLEARVEKWKSEITKLETQLAKFPEADPFRLKGLLMRTIENAKYELVDSEQKLRESNEKQSILREHGSNSLAESSTKQQQTVWDADDKQSIIWSAFESTA